MSVSALNACDFKCPICLCLLIKPVRTPCKHEMCLACFETNIQVANFYCPICRTRISSWARKAIREEKLVDKKRWRFIKAAFPNKVKLRLAGKDDIVSEEEEYATGGFHNNNVSEDGEIRKEYLDLLKQFQDEWRKEQELEEKESAALIKKLQEEEQCVIQSRLDHDFSFSLCLQKSINSEDFTENDNMKHIEELLPEVPSEKVTIRSSSVESHDSISSEMCHFKPINAAPCTPPKQLPDGRWVEPLVVHSVARHIDFSSSASNSPNHKVQKHPAKSKYLKGMKKWESAASTASEDEDLNLNIKHKGKGTIDHSYKENYPLKTKCPEAESYDANLVIKNVTSKHLKCSDSSKANSSRVDKKYTENEANSQSSSYTMASLGSQKLRKAAEMNECKNGEYLKLKRYFKRNCREESHLGKDISKANMENCHYWESQMGESKTFEYFNKKQRSGEVYNKTSKNGHSKLSDNSKESSGKIDKTKIENEADYQSTSNSVRNAGSQRTTGKRWNGGFNSKIKHTEESSSFSKTKETESFLPRDRKLGEASEFPNKKQRTAETFNLNEYEAALNIKTKMAQEEADRLIALKLQAEFDRVRGIAATIVIDRSKGSGNEYSFRKRKV